MPTTELVYESRNSRILVRENPEFGVHILKILNDEYPDPQQINQFFNEYEILRELDIPGIRKVYRWVKEQNRYTLYLEYFDGKTIKELQSTGLDLLKKLKIAANLSQSLGHIHENNIVHKDMTTGNLLVNPATLATCIIDFGISTCLTLKNQNLGNPEKLEGTLTYISPEQTGRMNRVVDYRTDMYSLGIVFFELFAGHPPFDETDPMRLVHAHLAVAPPILEEIVRDFPPVVSRIVDRLLSKKAEDRYQSAQGLLHDLNRCIVSIESNGVVEDFKIAEEDFSGKFQLNQQLYGREKELDQLMEAFARAQEGQSELVLIGGYSGTGKSALAHEIHRPITEKQGYFVEGKFDQYQRAVPYYAILQAFESFLDLLLTENEQKLRYFRDQILEAVGEQGKVLTDVIPNIIHLIGPQPEVVEVGGSEAQNRFNYVFSRFVGAIASKLHPLVLFIDDLQWADSSSLDLLRNLLTDSASKYFLCICAYRDNEVSPTHPFIVAVEEMRERKVDIFEIQIDNLRKEDVMNLISDSLSVGSEKSKQLMELVYEKTGGNAFFVTEFLKSLYTEGLVVFNYQARAWEWDIRKIFQHRLTDDVVKLMAGKVKRLDANTQEALKLASCIGNRFDLETLTIIYKKDEEETSAELMPALSEGLVLYYGDSYKFAHDRIQQAVYSLIPQEKRNALHLRIGRLLLNSLAEDELEEALFDVVNQLNWGRDILEDAKALEHLAELNLQAAHKAKQSSAFESAFEYAEGGIGLLKSDNWEIQYELSYNLYTEAAEAAYLSNKFEKAYGYVDILLEKSDDLLERVKPYVVRIQSLKAENKLPEALSTGLKLLDELGEKFPKKTTMLHVMPDLIKTLLLLRGKPDEAFVQLPVVTDPIKEAALFILANIAPSSYWADPTIFPLIIFRIVRLSIRYGGNAVSAFGFATYGVIMVGAFERIRTGYRFGKIGLAMLDKYHAKEWLAQVYTPVFALINIWSEHARNTLKPLLDSYHIALETGALEFACINANIYCIHAYFIGRPLEKTEMETAGYSNSFLQYNQLTNHKFNEIYRQAMRNFMGLSEDPLILTGEAYDEESGLAQSIERKDRTGTFFIYFHKMILGVYFGDYAMAWEHAVKARKLLDSVLAKFEVAKHHFYESLAATGLLRSGNTAVNQRRLEKRIRKNLRKMKKWASHAPENFQHNYHLILAEYAHIRGKENEARDYYDSAIHEAASNEYIHEEALANELAARFYRSQENLNLMDYHVRNAFQNYRDWGARAKMDQIQSEFPQVIINTFRKRTGLSRGATQTSTLDITTTLSDFTSLDLQSVLKASASISGEIVLDKLLVTLMQILSENLGATQGYLLLEGDGRFYIEAESRDAMISDQVRQHISIDEGARLPLSIIKYVVRTSEELVIDNVLEEKRFNSDPYILQQKPLSILLYPIVNKGNRIGLLYFENNLTEGAFTGERFDFLSLLSGQIAISLENALLYDSLEQKVIERTRELEEEKKKSDSLLLNILPESTAEELKLNGKAIPRRFDEVTVMFTDFKDFTRISANMHPEDLVNEIGLYFAEFDRIVERHQLEKIKTIGDSYMCAGGLPTPNDEHATNVINAALEIRDFMLKQKAERERDGRPHFAIRIGVHSGPVVAGVVGLKKFAYDIWGNTVNTASRMESACDLWKINVSGQTQALINEKYVSEYRGKIEVKNMGKIDMYYLEMAQTQPE